MAEVIKNRYEFTVLFEVKDGNPNGDPDAGNMPRIDIDTGHGIVTDVCLKRKIRNYIETICEDREGFKIYIKEGVPLSTSDKTAFKKLDIDEKNIKSLKKDNPELDKQVCKFMCENFFDIRAFGAVMTTFKNASLNCGQVRGPVQLGFARSIDPIVTQVVTITRGAITKEDGNSVLAPKYVVPYGLYRVDGYISANLARKVTGFNEDDLQILWQAIINMFEYDHSATRGHMAVRSLIVFKHDSELGNAHAYKLFESIKVKRKEGIIAARSFEDYEVNVDQAKIPAGVTCLEMI